MGEMMTLAQLAKLSKPNLKGYIVKNLLRQSVLFEMIPFAPVTSLTFSAIRWRNLPTVDSRRVNAGYTASHGDVAEVWEAVYGLGNDLNFDRIYEYTKGSQIVDPIQQQVDMTIESMRMKFHDLFINGDPGTDPDAFAGLKHRVTNMPARQKVNFTGAAGAPLDPTASAANARTYLDQMAKLYKRCNGKNVSAWLCNEDMELGFARVMRYAQLSGGNFMDVTKDSFDREFVTFYGAPIVDMGLKKDQSTEIMTNTEVAGDAGADSAHIFGVSFDEKKGIVGATLTPLDAYDPLNGGEQESKPAKLRRIDWWVGLAQIGSYGTVQGWNIEAPSAWT